MSEVRLIQQVLLVVFFGFCFLVCVCFFFGNSNKVEKMSFSVVFSLASQQGAVNSLKNGRDRERQSSRSTGELWHKGLMSAYLCIRIKTIFTEYLE